MYSKASNIGVILVAIVLVLAIIFLSVSLFRTMRKMEEKFSPESWEGNAGFYDPDFIMFKDIQLVHRDSALGLLFECHVSDELYEKVYNDSSKSFVTLIAWEDSLEKVQSAAETDWITMLESVEGASFLVIDNTPYLSENGNEWLLRSVVPLTKEKLYARNYSAISAIKTVSDGVTTYEYASLPNNWDYHSYNTSLVYECTKLLNRVKFGVNGETISADMDSDMRSVINYVVDTAKGETLTDNNSTFACTLPETLTMYVGDAMYLPITVSPADIPVNIYYHGNGDIASVERWTGKVTAKSPGTYLVTAYIGGEVSNVCTITIVE